MGKFSSYLLGFSIGGVIGGVTALLTTPKKGAELRQDFKTNIQEPIKDVTSSIVQVKDQVQQLTQESIPTIKATAKDVSELVSTWKADVQPHLVKLKEAIGQFDIPKIPHKKD
ncbi:YtxH domain-containing protein [Terrilactibacillus laevilacticus]|uniref:YtxH domain-containing protein n=1 Tax=Terrilactibacillus laevilacticus TaxID=1380157 RepID=A0ABW5PQQ4_9BACI|nr:YtxH domain-containing protein [Terrilactibacillus laevilacticus]